MTEHRLLPDIGGNGKLGCKLPALDVPEAALPDAARLRRELDIPDVSEGEAARYFTGLSRLNFGLDNGFYPLGSCTMKYNPKWHEDVAALPGFTALHPCQPEASVAGALQLIYEMQQYLAEITGMDAASLAPLAGAHGEFAGLLMVKAWHREHGGGKRNRVLITDSAHGTNAATATMCGYRVATVPSDARGDLDMKSLEAMMDGDVAALTLTLPNTLGLFDPQIREISRLVHERGGLLGGDGANLNALLGRVKFGELGFDYVQLNLHKTFGTPHGGGGPGSGPLCVKESLADFLPSPLVTVKGGKYSLAAPPRSIGRVSSFYGNFGVIVKAYAYIRSLGAEGLKEVSENAVINANYLKERLKDVYDLPYDRPCMHEVVLSGKRLKKHGVGTVDVAKRLLDYGIHPPTVYFPQIVAEALMIEPTETESKETLDGFIAAMKEIAREAAENPAILHSAPHVTPVRRLDEVKAARQLELRWPTGYPEAAP